MPYHLPLTHICRNCELSIYRVRSVFLKVNVACDIMNMCCAIYGQKIRESTIIMSEKAPVSRQQQKSRETREKIFRAAKRILEKKGYEELSIKNICEEAGVSNGSFYHHFKTKDDLLSYYIEDQPKIDPDLLEMPDSVEGVKAGIIQVYLNYVKYCRELGVEFMAEYYDTKNQALNAAVRTERPYPVLTVQSYVEKAIAAGIVSLNVEIEEFTTDIRMIVIGNVFEWCVKHGDADFEGNMSRSLGKYLDAVLCGESKGK